MGLGLSDEATKNLNELTQRRWRKLRVDHVIAIVLTSELAVEQTVQIHKKFSFLVKDYQPQYYYFECIFLIEKLILTAVF